MAGKHIKLHLEYLRVAIRTILEYRISFIIQVSSMMLNDLVWIIFWLLFFKKVQIVGGWQFEDMLLLYAIVTLAYGIAGVLYGNRSRIARLVSEGRLDYYLTLPKNVLYHVMISKSNWYDLGDFIFGLAIVVFFVPLGKIPLLILLVLLSTIIFLSFTIIVGSLAFYIGNAKDVEHTMHNSTIALASYPISIYKGFVKFIVLVIIPAGFISGVPVALIKEFNMQWFLLMIGFTILIAALAIYIFYRGLKKYESGNLLYVRS